MHLENLRENILIICSIVDLSATALGKSRNKILFVKLTKGIKI